ncbi:MAG TPA: hypothetical protein PKC87_02465 [Candidatus Absconditabacterales bacterium]|nr:hypothetical protein [Candidatus Absconditabacterales bacterium]
MRKYKVTGPSLEEIIEIFSNSIIYGKSSKIILYKEKNDTIFEVIIDKIDATIWHMSKSVFNDDEARKKILVFHGWINKEEGKKFSSTVTKNCTLEVTTNKEMVLKIKNI